MECGRCDASFMESVDRNVKIYMKVRLSTNTTACGTRRVDELATGILPLVFVAKFNSRDVFERALSGTVTDGERIVLVEERFNVPHW